MELFEIENRLAELMPGATSFVKAERNKINFETYWFNPDFEGVKKFNEIYLLVRDWKNAVLTKTKGISTGRKCRYYRKHIEVTKSGAELLIIAPKASYRVVFRNDYKKPDTNEGYSGKFAFRDLVKLLKKEGFDLLNEAITNGDEVKKTIPAPDIRLIPEFTDKTVYHAFHIDINSAYFAGIKQEHGHLGNGVFGQVIQRIYDERKIPGKGEKNKSMFNSAQGYMQSQYCKINGYPYALAHISKPGLVFCRNKLAEIIKHYEALGCKLIGTNTDGAWFTKPDNVSEETLRQGTSKELGGFKIDHYDCKLRFKTKGCYEFIENGSYTVKMRGQSNLDKVKAREDWQWGDIYDDTAEPIKYIFTTRLGYIVYNDSLDNLLN